MPPGGSQSEDEAGMEWGLSSLADASGWIGLSHSDAC